MTHRTVLLVVVVAAVLGAAAIAPASAADEEPLEIVGVEVVGNLDTATGATIDVTVRNPGSSETREFVSVAIGRDGGENVTETSQVVDVAPGSEETVRFRLSLEGLTGGQYLTVETADDRTSRFVTVEERTAVPPRMVSATVPAEGGTVEVPVDLTGDVSIGASHEVPLALESVENGTLVFASSEGGETVGAATLQDRATLTLDVDPSNASAGNQYQSSWRVDNGTHVQTIALEITVEEGEEETDPIAEYRDPDGNVTTEGLSRAIDDWARGEIDTETLSQVIRAWAETN